MVSWTKADKKKEEDSPFARQGTLYLIMIFEQILLMRDTGTYMYRQGLQTCKG